MKIAILGFGREGQSLVHYFGKQGHEITVRDIVQREEIPKKSFNVHFRYGPHYLDDLVGFDYIFRSPGIPLLKKELNPVRNNLTSLTRYFFEKCPCPIVGVTGTKGKGTTATLLFEMLRNAPQGKQRQIFLAGNIGSPPLDFLDELKEDDIVILELSSFQLQDLNRSPHVAVVLGITPDHLDYHADMEEYEEAKKNIVRFQTKSDVAIIDADNELSKRFEKFAKARILSLSLKESEKDGGFLKVGSLILKRGKTGIIIGEKANLGLKGDHNIKNILAAATVANFFNTPVEIISKTIREFHGLPHRLEFIKTVNGVSYYNDSASTNPDTTIAALRTFRDSLILIAGGTDKNLDYTPLGREIAKRLNIRSVVLMGQTKAKIGTAIEMAVASEEKNLTERNLRSKRQIRRRNIPLELITAETYQEAFMVASFIAKPSDVVLLSPGCSSFDMFSNYQERGDIFRNFVLNLGNS